jgi:hypothetical protein
MGLSGKSPWHSRLAAFGFSVFALCGVSGQVARADADSSFSEGIATLLGTRRTEVKLTWDGSRRFSRKYGENGELRELVFHDDTLRPALTERIEFDGSEMRIRTVYRGSGTAAVLVERGIERLSARGATVSGELLWSASGDGPVLDRRTVASYSGAGIRRSEYELSGEGWKLVSEADVPSVFGEAATDKNGTQEYLSCLQSAGKAADADACAHLLSSLPLGQEAFADLGAASAENLKCAEGDRLFLPNGYSIDLKTCAAPAARAKLEAMSDRVVGTSVSCLNRVNPIVAAKMAGALASMRPMLTCAGTHERVSDEAFCKKSDPGYGACADRYDRVREKTAAFYDESNPNRLFLSSQDPMGREGSRAPAGESAGDPGLIATIFHESLHASGHLAHAPHEDPNAGPLHDASPPSFGDAVYGCEALCGPSPAFVTQEGCSACAHAEGNRPSAGFTESCKNFPKAAVMRQLTEVKMIEDAMTRCELARAEAKSESCAGLRGFSAFKNLCGKKEPGDAACLAAFRVYAAKEVLAAARGPGAATAFAFAIANRAHSAPYDVTSAGVVVPGKGDVADPNASGPSRRQFAAIVTDGFCQTVQDKSPDFLIKGADLAKIVAQYGGGLFPEAPDKVRLNLEGRNGFGAPYPLGEMQLTLAAQAGLGKETGQKLDPSAAIEASGCKSWFATRARGYHP